MKSLKTELYASTARAVLLIRNNVNESAHSSRKSEHRIVHRVSQLVCVVKGLVAGSNNSH